jgi:hypothetical protein
MATRVCHARRAPSRDLASSQTAQVRTSKRRRWRPSAGPSAPARRSRAPVRRGPHRSWSKQWSLERATSICCSQGRNAAPRSAGAACILSAASSVLRAAGGGLVLRRRRPNCSPDAPTALPNDGRAKNGVRIDDRTLRVSVEMFELRRLVARRSRGPRRSRRVLRAPMSGPCPRADPGSARFSRWIAGLRTAAGFGTPNACEANASRERSRGRAP